MTDTLLLQKLRHALPVVFGSRVKGRATQESDMDLLVVANGIHPKRHRRGEQIALIKRNLPPRPYDILLFTESEVIANFQNHNPLFFDIAEEGQLLFDYNGQLQVLMKQTKEYIREKGVQKLQDGWAFPVQPGVPTPLSKVSNQDFAVAMQEDGKRDFIIGKKLLEDGMYDKAVYHFQQAVEKHIKSILIAIGVFKKTHFVGDVLREYVQEEKFPKRWQDELLEAAEISESVEPDVSLSRYPGMIDDRLWLPYEEYKVEDATQAMKKAERVQEIARSFTTRLRDEQRLRRQS